MPAQQGSWIATAYLETGTITRGYVACLNEEGTRYIVSTAANRAAAGRRSACIAITSGDADNPAGSSFEAQYVGAVPPSITGLEAGTASLLRVSSTGLLERVGEYSTSDDVCGHCDEDGVAYVCFPLVGLGAALGASSAPGLPSRSVQYYLDANTLGGAAHASISSDGCIETRTASESVATTGHWRTGYNVGTILAAKDAGAVDRAVISQSTTKWQFGSDTGSWGTNVFGSGSGVIIKSFSAGLVLDSIQQETRISGVSKQTLTASVLATGVPRIGLSVPWGASEGTSTISSSGTYTLINDEFDYAHNVFSSASTGTFTYPAPGTQQTYFRWLQETGGTSKTITIGSGTTYTLAANSSVWVRFDANGVFALSASSSVNYRKDVVGAGASLGYVDLTVNGKDATTLNINVSSGSGDCDGFAHDLVDPETMVLTVIITLNGGGAEGGGSGTFTFNALAGATAAYMIRDFDGSSNDIVIGLNSVIQFVWDGNGWRLISSVAL